MKKQFEIIKATFLESVREGSSNWMSLDIPVVLRTKRIKKTEVTFMVHNAAILKFFGLPSIVPGAGAVIGGDGIGRIVVNDAFLSIPEEVQEAILLHEKGHLTHKDVVPKFYLLKRLFGHKDILQQEFAADLYSLRNGGQMFNALCWMRDSGFYNSKEINKRILNLLVEGGR